MKCFPLATPLLLVGCASSGLRAPANTSHIGQKYSCSQFKAAGDAPVMVLWVSGDNAVVSFGEGQEARYANVTPHPHAAGRNAAYTYDHVKSGDGTNDATLDLDARMHDDSWKKDLLSNDGGTTVFPSLYVMFADSDRDVPWDCKPGNDYPTY